MKCKDFLKVQSTVLKHKKQRKFLTKENKVLKNIVFKLIKINEDMKQDLQMVINDQEIHNNDNMLTTLVLSVLMFCFLKYMKHLHKKIMNNNSLICSNIDIDKIIYSMIILQIVYICIYLQHKYKKHNIKT